MRLLCWVGQGNRKLCEAGTTASRKWQGLVQVAGFIHRSQMLQVPNGSHQCASHTGGRWTFSQR